MAWNLSLGFAFGVLVGGLAWRAGALTRNGALAATVTGGLIFGLGGLPWAVLLLTFFVSSSALSRAFARRKADLGEKFAKGSRRDWAQVLANGGMGALLAILWGSLATQSWLWAAYAGALAAVNADTWATELGVLSTAPPRLLTSGRVVERGTSGGVTLLGSLAAVGGAGLIGLVAALLSPTHPPLPLILVTTLAGLAGALLDSLLGATVQAIYTCPLCERETERHPQHTCGTPTTLRRGWPWLNNDLVNLAASSCGAGLAAAAWILLQWSGP